MSVAQDAFYLPVEGGECFCVHRRSAVDPVVVALLHLPAFGDEMNKARAMTARAARAFAGHGCAVLQMDWIGCGDSSGDHADATFARWRDNALSGIAWLRGEHRNASIGLWSLRAGALMIPGLLEHLARDAPVLLWQPMLTGRQLLNQLIRQKSAGGLLAPDAGRGETKALRERLRKGEPIEIGGYTVSPRLAADLEDVSFDIASAHCGRIAWLEVAPVPEPDLPPASRTKLERLRAAGMDVRCTAVQGPAFWQSVEIEYCDALIEASISMLALDPATRALSRDGAVV